MIPKNKGFTAIDPDGFQFWYEKEPILGNNHLEIETWIAETGSKVKFMGRVKPPYDFKNSLKKL